MNAQIVESADLARGFEIGFLAIGSVVANVALINNVFTAALRDFLNERRRCAIRTARSSPARHAECLLGRNSMFKTFFLYLITIRQGGATLSLDVLCRTAKLGLTVTFRRLITR